MNLKDIVTGLLAREPLVYLLLGAAFLATGATGGWPTIHVTVAEEPWRIAIGFSGAALVALATWLAAREIRPDNRITIDPKDYEIAILSPQSNAQVTTPVTILGHGKNLPEGWELWVFRIAGMGLTRKYWPVAPAEIMDNTWRVGITILNHQPNERRKYGVFIVGRDGQCLANYFRAAGPTLAPSGNWPPIAHLTSDIIAGPTVEVTLPQTAPSQIKTTALETPGKASQGQ